MSKEQLLEDLKREILARVDAPLYAYRTENHYHMVMGEGDAQAKLVFVGEAPGKNEAETGRPFCGAAGRVLDEMLDLLHLKREGVYITNIVKDRPPENRDPFPDEISWYAPFLERQLAIIQPKVIATLGRFSMQHLFATYGLLSVLKPISKLHGTACKAVTSFGEVWLLPLYHPAATLYKPQTRTVLEEDMKKLPLLLQTDEESVKPSPNRLF